MDTSVARRTEYATLGKVLREAREELGLSQRALAKKLGRTQTAVHKIEAGVQRLDVVGLLDIAHALRLPMTDLAGRFEAAVRAEVPSGSGS